MHALRAVMSRALQHHVIASLAIGGYQRQNYAKDPYVFSTSIRHFSTIDDRMKIA